MLLICAEEDLPATGIDKFARSVEMAAARGLRVLQGDERCPDLAPESYDAIFMQSVLEHLADPIPVLQRLIVALRPGGTLVLSSPTPGGDFWNDPTHVRPYTPRSFRVLADLLGLKAVEVNYVFSFLLGVRLESSLVYKTLNLVPFSLGSNLIGFFRKPHHGAG